MPDSPHSIRQLFLALVASLVMHVLLLNFSGLFATHDLTRPITPSPDVTLELSPAPPARTESAPQASARIFLGKRQRGEKTTAPPTHDAISYKNGEEFHQQLTTPPPPLPPAGTVPEPSPTPVAPDWVHRHLSPHASPGIRKDNIIVLPPLRSTAEFLSAEEEVLSYRISMLGLPVGSGELTAKRDQSGVRISLRVASNALIATLYPVDDRVETRLLGGNYIITRIRQREGAFRGERGFTLFLRERSVFWIDLLKKVSTREPLPTSDVLDILSGLYYLRNRPLQVGKSERLQIFDSNVFTSVPVEVLRREELSLSGVGKVNALLLHPRLVTEGIFRRTGEIRIWVTDDERHVPVRMETSVLPGRVTAELVDSRVTEREKTENEEGKTP